MGKKSTHGYTNRMMSKSLPSGSTQVRITLTKAQYEQAQRIATRHGLDVDAVIQRYVLRCIADLSHP